MGQLKWFLIGALLYAYVMFSTLVFRNYLYFQISGYMLIGYIFGNWAGQEEKEEKKRKKNG